MKKGSIEYQKQKLNRVLGNLLATAGLLALSACGAAEAPPEDAGSDTQSSSSGSATNGCSSGQYSVHGSCITASSFLEACQTALGTPVTVNGIDVCQKTTRYVTGATSYAFASAYMPSGYYYGSLSGDYDGSEFYGVTTTLTAEVGDKINYSARGSWGYTTVSTSSYLNGWLNFSTSNTNCKKVDQNGTPYSGSSLTDKGFLVISDGTTTTPIPSTETSFIATSSGTLRVGFAIDSYYASQGACGSFTVYSLSVTHCEDEAGNTQSCQ
jgi:hypothetical protein